MSKVKAETVRLTRISFKEEFQTLTPQEQKDNQYVLQELDEAQTLMDLLRVMSQAWDLTATAKRVAARKQK